MWAFFVASAPYTRLSAFRPLRRLLAARTRWTAHGCLLADFLVVLKGVVTQDAPDQLHKSPRVGIGTYRQVYRCDCTGKSLYGHGRTADSTRPQPD